MIILSQKLRIKKLSLNRLLRNRRSRIIEKIQFHLEEKGLRSMSIVRLGSWFRECKFHQLG